VACDHLGMSDISENEEEIGLLLYLGTMIRDAAHMEVTVESLTGHLIASHDRQAPSVRGEPLSALIRKCRSAARQVARVDSDQRESLDSLLDRISAVAELRNAYVHGGWARDFDGSYVGVRGKRGQEDLISHAVSGDQLLDMINEIRSINSALLDWLSHDLDIIYAARRTQAHDQGEPAEDASQN
jgi:hypothetical protein